MSLWESSELVLLGVAAEQTAHTGMKPIQLIPILLLQLFGPSMLFSRQTGWAAQWSRPSQFSDPVKRNFKKKQLFSMQSCKDLRCNQYVGSRWSHCLSQESVQTQTGCIVILKSKCKEFSFLSKTLLKMSFRGEKSLCGAFLRQQAVMFPLAKFYHPVWNLI